MTPVRIAVLVDDLSALAGWERRLFDTICSDSRLAIVAALVDRRGGSNAAPLFDSQRSPLLGLVTFIESAISPAPPYDGGRLFEAVLRTGHIFALGSDEKSAEKIRALGLDVILHHGTRRVDTRLLSASRFGVWSLDCRAGDAGLAEAIARAPVTGVTLMRWTAERAPPEVLARAYFNTDRFAVRNRDRIRELSASLVQRELARLAAAGGVGASEDGELVPEPADNPSTADILGYCATAVRQLAAGAGRIVARQAGFRPHMWSLFQGVGDPFDAMARALSIEAVPAKGELWADPFLLVRDGVSYIFFENYSYARRRAKISVAKLDGMSLRMLGDALDLSHHLSFPFVFESGGETYLVPEQSAARSIEVWRAVDFPLRWERHARALEGQSAADTVLFEDNGRWWMLSNLSQGPIEDFCNELHLFSIDGPALRHVEPHPLNPVVIDSRTARNGGRVFRRDGKLYRTSQHNAHGEYGWGLNLMEITRLDMEGYAERCIRTIVPDFRSGLIGCHHADMADGRFVIDACRRYG